MSKILAFNWSPAQFIVTLGDVSPDTAAHVLSTLNRMLTQQTVKVEVEVENTAWVVPDPVAVAPRVTERRFSKEEVQEAARNITGKNFPPGPDEPLLPGNGMPEARRVEESANFGAGAPREEVPPPAPPLAPAPGASTPASPAPATTVSRPSSDAVFLRLTKLEEVVREVQAQGAKTLDEIKTRCHALRDAEMCPVLGKIRNLDERLERFAVATGLTA